MKTRTAARKAKKVAYQRRLKRTSSMGPKMTAQKLGDKAIAVMAAILASETWCVASTWGIAKKAMPLYKPKAAFERPMSQVGGTWRFGFRGPPFLLRGSSQSRYW